MSLVLQLPGNRREVVKTNPTMLLSAVLAEACGRGPRPLGNPAEFALMHGKKAVDLSSPLRFAGLASGTVLEPHGGHARVAGLRHQAAQRPGGRQVPAKHHVLHERGRWGGGSGGGGPTMTGARPCTWPPARATRSWWSTCCSEALARW